MTNCCGGLLEFQQNTERNLLCLWSWYLSSKNQSYTLMASTEMAAAFDQPCPCWRDTVAGLLHKVRNYALLHCSWKCTSWLCMDTVTIPWIFFGSFVGTWYCCYTRLPLRACRASDNFQNWLKSVIFLFPVCMLIYVLWMFSLTQPVYTVFTKIYVSHNRWVFRENLMKLIFSGGKMIGQSHNIKPIPDSKRKMLESK